MSVIAQNWAVFEGVEDMFQAERTQRAAKSLLHKADNDLMRSHLYVIAHVQDLIDEPSVNYLVTHLVPIHLDFTIDETAIKQAGTALRSVFGRSEFRNQASFLLHDLITESTVTMMRHLPLDVQRVALSRYTAFNHLATQSCYTELASISSNLTVEQVSHAFETMPASWELLGLNQSFVWNRDVTDLMELVDGLDDLEVSDNKAFVPLTDEDIDVLIEYLNYDSTQFPGAQFVFNNPNIQTSQLLSLFLIDRARNVPWMTEYLLAHPNFPADIANEHWRSLFDREPSAFDGFEEWELFTASRHPGLELSVRRHILFDHWLPSSLNNWTIAANMRNDDLLDLVDVNEWFDNASTTSSPAELRLFLALDDAGKLDITHWHVLAAGKESAQYLAAVVHPKLFPMTPLFARRAIETSKALLRDDLEWKPMPEARFWWQLPGAEFLPVDLPGGVRERNFKAQDFDVHLIVTTGELADIGCQSWHWVSPTRDRIETRQFVAATLSREFSRWLVTFEVRGNEFVPFQSRRLRTDLDDQPSVPAYWSPSNAKLEHGYMRESVGLGDPDEDGRALLEIDARRDQPLMPGSLREIDRIENDLLDIAMLEIATNWSVAQKQFEQSAMRGLDS